MDGSTHFGYDQFVYSAEDSQLSDTLYHGLKFCTVLGGIGESCRSACYLASILHRGPLRSHDDLHGVAGGVAILRRPPRGRE